MTPPPRLRLWGVCEALYSAVLYCIVYTVLCSARLTYLCPVVVSAGPLTALLTVVAVVPTVVPLHAAADGGGGGEEALL